MQYAIHYNAKFRHFDEVNEVIFDYKGTESIIDFIPKILKKENQRAVINLNQIEDIKEVIPFINKLKTIHSNLIVQIDYFNQKKYIELLQDNEINFMFSNFAKDYDTYYSMAELGAKDIYIVEYLGFCLDKLQFIKNKYQINLRVIPDIAQSAKGSSAIVPQITKFWVRPEDTELYEEYIDIFEICRSDDRQSVIYEIYKRQQWLGNIEDIIMDLDIDVKNENLNPRFGLERLNCGKKCMYGRCTLCQRMEDLALRFNLAGISIQKKKKKEEISEEEKELLKERYLKEGK